jgi:hypothetical protein
MLTSSCRCSARLFTAVISNAYLTTTSFNRSFSIPNPLRRCNSDLAQYSPTPALWSGVENVDRTAVCCPEGTL